MVKIKSYKRFFGQAAAKATEGLVQQGFCIRRAVVDLPGRQQ